MVTVWLLLNRFYRFTGCYTLRICHSENQTDFSAAFYPPKAFSFIAVKFACLYWRASLNSAGSGSIASRCCGAGRSQSASGRLVSMSAKSATLLTVLMLSAILFTGLGLLSIETGGSAVASDGYGISSFHQQ